VQPPELKESVNCFLQSNQSTPTSSIPTINIISNATMKQPKITHFFSNSNSAKFTFQQLPGQFRQPKKKLPNLPTRSDPHFFEEDEVIFLQRTN
jgi:hypothetical protein